MSFSQPSSWLARFAPPFFKRSLLPTLGLLALIICSGTSHAQGVTRQSQILSVMCAEGSFDQTIAQASQWIQAAQNDPNSLDPGVFYWRGWAEFNIGWYGQSKRDMQMAMRAGIQAQRFSPQEVVARIATMEAVLPPQMEEVQENGKTYFRAYYSEKDAVTQAILDALPTAYQVDATMYGAVVVNQLILIFDTPEQVDAYTTAHGSHVPDYAVAYSDGSALVFCKWKLGQNLEDKPKEEQEKMKQSIAGTVTHEYNHCVLTRVMGRVKIPDWFIEGIADYAKGQVVEDTESRNDADIERLIKNGALVNPRNLEEPNSFRLHTSMGKAMREDGTTKGAASPYAQGYHMVRFLMDNMQDDQLTTFLNQVRTSKSFEGAMQASFGMNLNSFYQQWSQSLPAQAIYR